MAKPYKIYLFPRLTFYKQQQRTVANSGFASKYIDLFVLFYYC